MKVMLANGTITTVTPGSDRHLWRALQVGVGRLAIILELQLRVVPNAEMVRWADRCPVTPALRTTD
jgi:hypothetical protein